MFLLIIWIYFSKSIHLKKGVIYKKLAHMKLNDPPPLHFPTCWHIDDDDDNNKNMNGFHIFLFEFEF